MKKYIIIMAILLSVFVYFGVQYNSRKIRIIRVGTECDYAPNNWEEDRDTNSNVPLANKEGYYAEGYDIQIAKIVANKIGAKLEVKKIAWEDLIPALSRREIDAIFSGMLDTEERRRTISFSEVYEFESTEYAVIVHRNGKYANAKTLNDFAGARFTGQKDTNLYTAIDQLPGAIPRPPVDTVSEMLEQLLEREVDGIVINLDTGRTYERTYKNLMLIQFPKDEGFKFEFKGICAGVRKSDTRLLKEINDVLNELPTRERRRIMDRIVAREWENL